MCQQTQKDRLLTHLFISGDIGILEKKRRYRSMEKLPGSAYLKVAGILYLIFGVIAAVSLFALAALADSFGAGGVMGLALFLSVLIVALDIVAGILGIRFHNSVEKAPALSGYGIVLLVVVIVNLVVNAVLGALNVFGVVGLILPILFLTGARKNKQAA
jgi:hypothetical protein